jgi:hypothetical protein
MIKKGLPLDLIILQDKKGHKRILEPECRRIALTRTEHETMLHLKGNRVNHELSRSYFWPHMAKEIKLLCSACQVCQQALVQRQNLSATFRQADEKDLPLPRQWNRLLRSRKGRNSRRRGPLHARSNVVVLAQSQARKRCKSFNNWAHPSKGCPINIPQ